MQTQEQVVVAGRCVATGRHGDLVETEAAFVLLSAGEPVDSWPKSAAGRQAAAVAPHLGAAKANETYRRQVEAHRGKEGPPRRS